VAENEQAQDLDVVQRLDEVRDALADLSRVLGQEEELGRVLQRGVDQLTRAIPGAEMASVSVLRGDTAETVAVDSDQYAVGEGPALEAARTDEIVRVSVEQASERWPEFARSARAAGVASYLSCPLVIDEKFAGSLNLYSMQPHGFGDLDEALANAGTVENTLLTVTSQRPAGRKPAGGIPSGRPVRSA